MYVSHNAFCVHIRMTIYGEKYGARTRTKRESESTQINHTVKSFCHFIPSLNCSPPSTRPETIFFILPEGVYSSNICLLKFFFSSSVIFFIYCEKEPVSVFVHWLGSVNFGSFPQCSQVIFDDPKWLIGNLYCCLFSCKTWDRPN